MPASALIQPPTYPPNHKVHLLLQADPGHAEDVLATVTALPGLIDAALTSGAYDVVAEISVVDEGDVTVLVAGLRRLTGLAGLSICRPGS